MGGLAPSIEKYLPEIQSIIAKFAPSTPKLQITQLEDLSTAIGALRVGIEEVERSAIRKLLSISTWRIITGIHFWDLKLGAIHPIMGDEVELSQERRPYRYIALPRSSARQENFLGVHF